MICGDRNRIRSLLKHKSCQKPIVMKNLLILFGLLSLFYVKIASGAPWLAGKGRCINVWDDGCINGEIDGSGRDDDYNNGGFNPGKRCINVWDDGCSNGQLPGSGRDDYFNNGGFNPGKRCINVWDDGCSNGQLPGSGRDDDFNNGGFNPGKRCVGKDCNGKIYNLGKDGTYFNKQLIYKILAKINRNQL